jgi:hypothetical protein
VLTLQVRRATQAFHFSGYFSLVAGREPIAPRVASLRLPDPLHLTQEKQ